MPLLHARGRGAGRRSPPRPRGRWRRRRLPSAAVRCRGARCRQPRGDVPSARTGPAWRRARRGRPHRAAVRRGRHHRGQGTPTRRQAAPAGGRPPRRRAGEPSSSRDRLPPRGRPADRTGWRDRWLQDGPVPSPDPSAGTAFRVRAGRVAGEEAVFRRVDVDVVDARVVEATATFGFAAAGFAAAGFAAAGFAAAGFAAAGFAAAGFARALDRAGDAARVWAGRSSLIRAVSWATSARASDACRFRFASTSRAFWRRFSSRANAFSASFAAVLGSAVPAD